MTAGGARGRASGLVTFRLGAQEYATPLDAVREVVRLHGLHDLPGMAPPLAGVLELRGAALPVLDLRAAPGPCGRGDVLVLDGAEDGSSVGVAVDQVRAVVGPDELVEAGAGAVESVLPTYVRGVLHGPAGVVFLVELAAMVDSARRAGAQT
jgi:chemotaxis signal transduction protein